MLTLGQEFPEYKTTVTEEDIQDFGRASRDLNPLHFDSDYASRTIFKRPIAHGILSLSRISAFLGTQLVDTSKHNVVYLKQSAEFLRPVFVGDTLTVKAQITAVNSEKKTYGLSTDVYNQDGKKVVVGEALIMLAPLT